jgi:hypothetical protein
LRPLGQFPGQADLHRPGVGGAAADEHAGQVRLTLRPGDDEPGELDGAAGQRDGPLSNTAREA